MVNPESQPHPGGGRGRHWPLVAVALGALAAPAGADPTGDAPSLTNQLMVRATAAEAVGEMLAQRPSDCGPEVVVIPATTHRDNPMVGELIARRLIELGYTVRIEDQPLHSAPPADTGAAAETGTASDTTDTGEGAPAAGADSAGTTAGAGPAPGQSILEHLQSQAGAIPHPDSVRTTPAAPVPRERRTIPDGDRFVYRLGLSELKYIDESRAFFLGPKRVERGVTVHLSCRVTDGESGAVKWLGEGTATRVDTVPKGKLAVFESTGYAPTRVKGPGMMRIVEPVVVGGIVAGLVVLFYTNQN